MSRFLSRFRAAALRRRGFDVATGLERAAALRRRRPRMLAAALALLTAGAILLALRMDGDASTKTVAGGSRSARATADLHRRFGEEPIVVLVKGNKDAGRLPALLLTEDLSRMLGLEGCLSGNIPRGGKAPAPPCAKLARSKPIQVVYGPGTFINESARQIASRFEQERRRGRAEAEQAAAAARKIAAAQGKSPAEQARLAAQARELALAQTFRDALGLALRFGLSRVPQLNDPDFVLKLVFEPSLGFATPKPRFAYLFPTDETALIQARLRPGLSESERRDAIALVREATSSKPFRLDRGRYLVAGAPVAESGVAKEIPNLVWPVGIAAVVLVAFALALGSRATRRLLPLLPGLVAAILTLGVMSLAGVSLDFGTLAVVPVLIGLGTAAALLLRWASEDSRRRAPVVATALSAALLGLLALLVSPSPIARELGGFTALGIVLSLACTFALVPLGPAARAESRGGSSLLHRRRPGRLVAIATGHPRRALLAALALAIAGWAFSTQVGVATNLTRLAPGGVREVKDEKTLERETGAAGDANVVVKSPRLTSPAVLRWMAGYQRRILARHGFRDDRRCQRAELCPALSLTSLVGTARSERQVRQQLDTLPPYFSRAVVSPDRRTANIAFTVRKMPIGDQRKLFADMRASLDPPAGVTAELAGETVVLADAAGELRTSWLAISGTGLAAIFLLLFAVYRRNRPVLVPLLPALLATGWWGLNALLLSHPMRPLSAGLVAAVIALSSAYGVIAAAGFRSQRTTGSEPTRAVTDAYAELRAPLRASGLVAVAGFAALIVSSAGVLRDAGVVATIALADSLFGAAIVLAAALVWAEQRRPLPLPRTREEALALARSAAATAGRGLERAGRRTGPLGRGLRRGGAAVGVGIRKAGRKARGLRRRDGTRRPSVER